MTKWNYTCDTFGSHGDAGSNLSRKTETGLNVRGAEGWEVISLVQTSMSIVVWYKRPNLDWPKDDLKE